LKFGKTKLCGTYVTDPARALKDLLKTKLKADLSGGKLQRFGEGGGGGVWE
jgi:hypothetical protein